jgi:hypothetical protein
MANTLHLSPPDYDVTLRERLDADAESPLRPRKGAQSRMCTILVLSLGFRQKTVM